MLLRRLSLHYLTKTRGKDIILLLFIDAFYCFFAKKCYIAELIYDRLPVKTKFEIEYPLRTSSKVLYKRLSSSTGLSEWFADDVTQQGNIFTFEWNGSKQRAEQIDKEKLQSVSYRWLSEEQETYFKFLLEVDEITNSLSLIITDFAEEDEIDESIELWDKQIEVLKRKLGI